MRVLELDHPLGLGLLVVAEAVAAVLLVEQRLEVSVDTLHPA